MFSKYIIGLGIICFLFVPQIGNTDTQCLRSDLAIAIIDNPDPVNAGEFLTYSVTANNNGPQNANNVVITLVLPVGISYQTGPDYCAELAGSITCQMGAVNVGTQTFDFVANVDAAVSGYIASAGTIESLFPDAIDPVPGNNNTNVQTFVLGPVLAISINDVDVNEPESSPVEAIFNVSLSQQSLFEVTVEFETVDNSAIAGFDYLSLKGIVTFPPQATEQQIIIPILPDAETVEGSETFYINLKNATYAVISDPQGVGRISDPCLFCDHFDDNILRTDWTYTKPCWVESGHSLTGTPCSSRRTFAIAKPAFAGAGNGTVEAFMQTAGGPGNTLWLLAWFQDKKNTVELIMKEEKNTWVLKQRYLGKVVSKKRVRMPIETNIKYLVKIIADGNKFDFYVNDQFVMELPQVTPVYGSVAFRTKDTVGRFCKIYVNAMEEN